jgi:hypothetical protein
MSDLVFNKETLFKFFFVFISELKFFEGRAAMYKRVYHIVLRRAKKLSRERTELKKEVKRLNRLLELHEDMVFSWL